ncbi:hypothetical protein H8M03_12195 [Sphingomonas sabuli]|uniref:Uncharacterized protein n=1 Tax=Sphingomonas sabuli TaxID=2764186 RepID=A0A7G9L283_9SPHN|nr:hypothetical protein [Sphingomonas sabuli]QNM82732.1 hypothetical protein H8M03_12195 [Sphingomonas sabuli]
MRTALASALAAMLLGAAAPAELDVGPHLAQVRDFSRTEGEKVWTGYGDAPFGFLLVGEKTESLLCRDQVPDGFVAAGADAATGCKRFTRPRSGMPNTLLAAMPLFGPPSVIVMGTPKTTNRTEANWVRTILHEHFHQWQYALPGYFDRINALDLHDGDQTGMWILNYKFPYDDPAVNTAFNAASNKLADAVAARATPGFGAALADYLTARKALAAAAGERNWRYFELQLWQEGVARWTEIRLGKWYPRQDVRDGTARLEAATLDALRKPDLPGKARESVYPYGAAEVMLLQACGEAWRSAYPKDFALGPLLETARANPSCA